MSEHPTQAQDAAPKALSPEEAAQLIHELRTHQVELEMQNEELRRTQAELAAERARYFMLYDLAPAGACTFHEDGTVVDANHAAGALLGAPESSLIGQPMSRFILSWSAFVYDLRRRKPSQSDEALSWHLRMVKCDGTQFWARLAASVGHDAGGAPLYRIAMNDVTERVHAEEALRLSEERYRKLFEHTPDGVLVADAEGLYLDVNARMCRMLGWTRDELIGRSALDIVVPAEVPHINPALSAIHSRTDYHREWEFRRKDGSTFPGDVTVTTLPDGHLLALVRDVTARKEADDALRRLEARHASMIANIGDVIAIVEPDGVYRYQSPNLEKVLGWRPEEVVGRSTWEYVHPDDHDRMLERFQTVMETANASRTTAGRYRCKDGSYKWIEICAVNLLHDPNIRGMLANFHDVTERTQAAEQLEARNFLLKALINSPPDLTIFSVDRRYAYLAFNEKHREEMRKIWHVEIEVGTSLLDCMTDPARRDLIRRAIDRALTGESFVEERYQPDLNTDYELRWNPIRQDDGRIDGVTVFVRDITERTRAEEALRASEARYRSILNASPDNITITDLEGRVLMTSPAAWRMFGYEREEDVLGHLMIEGIVPEDRARAVANVLLMAQGTPPGPGEYRGLRLDQSTFDIEVNGEFIRDAAGRPTSMVFVVRDVTERKQVEEIVAFLARTSSGTATEPFCDALARHLAERLEMDLVCIDRLEPDGLTAQVLAVWCDGKFQKNMKFALKDSPCGDLVGKGVECVSSGVRQSFPNDALLAHLGAESYLGVTLFSHTGKPIGLISLVSRRPLEKRRQAEDTLKLVAGRAGAELERLEAEAALSASEHSYRLLFDGMFGGFAVHELVFDEGGQPVDYRFLSVNPAFERLTGLRAADIVGRTASEVLPALEPAWIERYARVALGGEGIQFEDYSSPLRRHFQVSAFRPKLGQFATVFLDITERREAEESLRRSLKEKDALLREVHHRVKNNLQVINSLLRLETARSEHPSTRTVLGEMQGRIQSMALLHESLYRSGSFAGVDLGAYLKQLTTQSFRAQGHPGRIHLELDLASVAVGMDKAVPCGLLVNELISNGLKHGFPDGREGAIRVELKSLAGGTQARLCVSDTGVGLPADFESRRGNSLGLQLVSDLSGQLGGRLEIGEPPAASFAVTFTVDERNSRAPSATE